VPDPAADWMPCSGVTVCDGTTYALPPPPSVGEAEADGPMTATVPAFLAGIGSVWPLFWSRVVPVSATRVPRS
jgi:hypothetical protein